jgi:soluble lytic murein transglycosylase-like protein
MFLKALITWFLGVFIMFSGYLPFTCPFGRPEKPVQEASRNSQILVPEIVPTTEPGKKKENLSIPDTSVKGERSFLPIIQRASHRYNIDAALVRAIIMVESEYNPNAISVKGAKGLMQLMPVTAKHLGVVNVFNPEQNIHAGVRHFKFLLEQFDGDVKLALAAYNAGTRHVKRYNAVPPFKETKRYLKKVFRYYEKYKNTGG